MIASTIRARLALWYAAALAFFLVIFATAGYVFVARTSIAEMDSSLLQAANAVASAVDLESSELHFENEAIPRVVEEFRFRDMAVAVLDRFTGTLVTAQELSAPNARATLVPLRVPDLLPVLVAHEDEPAFVDVTEGGEALRLAILPYRYGPRPITIATVRSLGEHQQLLHELRLAIALSIPVLLLLATWGGYLLARQGLAPVAAMTEHAARIGASTLHERLPVGNAEDELGRLATVFNDLLARLDRAFEQQRQFMADASHELRTPVSIVGGEAELALSRDHRSPEELRGALGVIQREAGRLKRIVDDLFLLARATAGEQLLASTDLYLGELASECVRAVRSLAAARHITLEYEGSVELPYRGDEALLRRLLINLLDNAIKYTPEGGRVTLTAESRPDEYLLQVSDTGPGVPEDSRARIFDRFYRVRAEGSAAGDLRLGGGAGLGLPIARWIAEEHGGRLELTRTGPEGSTFTVTLPRALSQAPMTRGNA